MDSIRQAGVPVGEDFQHQAVQEDVQPQQTIRIQAERDGACIDTRGICIMINFT
jgi:hypothetical protein